jgi:hypothetical protein
MVAEVSECLQMPARPAGKIQNCKWQISSDPLKCCIHILAYVVITRNLSKILGARIVEVECFVHDFLEIEQRQVPHGILTR